VTDGTEGPRSRSTALLRGFILLSIVLAAAVIGLWLELERARSAPAAAPESATAETPRLVLEPATIGDLVGWTDDPLDGLARALGRSCAVLAAKARAAPTASPSPEAAADAGGGAAPAPRGPAPSATRAGGIAPPPRDPASSATSATAGGGLAGTPADWSRVCTLVAAASDSAALRQVLATELRPWSVRVRGGAGGDARDGNPLDRDSADREPSHRDPPLDRDQALLTGYYEPLLHGSLRRTGRFTVPLYLRPPELVDVDLGAFREELRGRRLAGIVRGSRLVPFADRERLERGALDGRGLELVWVDDPIDAFFLHIQGSGRVELTDGTQLRVGYAAQNGHPYVAIGKELVARGALALEDVTMQSIRAWLASHPADAAEIMRKNPSFVFFRKLDGDGPVGSQGVVLEPYRSIAVDPAFLPLGTPVWLDGSWPAPRVEDADRPLRRLVVAQDTGGAIRGALRADLFCGHGAEAAEVAGRLKHPARMWILLPRRLEPALEPTVPR
jgi:membrane-bound lytic murein transglycosylase